MPMYEFRCEDCGALFEQLVNNAESPVSCVKCQSSRIKKQFSDILHRASDVSGGDIPSGACNTCDMSGSGMCGAN